jgi:hypothetical protein
MKVYIRSELTVPTTVWKVVIGGETIMTFDSGTAARNFAQQISKALKLKVKIIDV